MARWFVLRMSVIAAATVVMLASAVACGHAKAPAARPTEVRPPRALHSSLRRPRRPRAKHKPRSQMALFSLPLRPVAQRRPTRRLGI